MNTDLQALLSDAESYLIEARKGNLKAAREAKDAVNLYQTLRENGEGAEPWEAADDYAGDMETEAINIIERAKRRTKQERTCSRCNGQGSTVCSSCSGNAKVVCATCRAAGQLVCPNCRGRGQVIRSLSIRQAISREEVTARSGSAGLSEDEFHQLDPSASDIHGVLDPQGDYNVALECDVSTPGPDNVPSELRDHALPDDVRKGVQEVFAAAKAKTSETRRVIKHTIRIREAKVWTVTYKYLGKTYQCRLVGHARVLAPCSPMTDVIDLRNKITTLNKALKKANAIRWLWSSLTGRIALVLACGFVLFGCVKSVVEAVVVGDDESVGKALGMVCLYGPGTLLVFWAVASVFYDSLADKAKLQARLDKANAPLLTQIRAAEGYLDRLLQPSRDAIQHEASRDNGGEGEACFPNISD